MNRAAQALALHGAAKRKEAWIEQRNAVAAQLRAEKGLPPHPAFEPPVLELTKAQIVG